MFFFFVLTVGYLKDIGAVQVESWNHIIFSSNKKAVSLQTLALGGIPSELDIRTFS